MDTTLSLEQQRQLVSALQQQFRQLNPDSSIDLIETHISWVLLAADSAYKIKKAVNLGFLDFSTLTQREHFCREELRLNQRLAPDYYLDVSAITGTPDHPTLGGSGPIIEHALRMRRFPRYQLLNERSTNPTGLTPIFYSLASRVAEFHVGANAADSLVDYGNPDSVSKPAFENIGMLLSCVTLPQARVQVQTLDIWQKQWVVQHRTRLVERKLTDWIREGHGDLHFGNIAVTNDDVIIFDCLEFNPALIWIDVCCDYAFLIMDCLYRDLWPQAIAFLNRYLEITGDYAGVVLLRFYVVYRALVRAKINAIRAQQTKNNEAWQETYGYIALADRVAHSSKSLLILTCGVSGSGKSYLSEQLVAALPAVRVRSDVERKRLFALDPLARLNVAVAAKLYTRETTERTYTRLLDCATNLIEGGIPVIIDATFQRRGQRERFLNHARAVNIPCVIVHTTASTETLLNRIQARNARNNDASDADQAVLALQQRTWEPLSDAELSQTLEVNTDEPIDLPRIMDGIRSRSEAFISGSQSDSHPAPRPATR